MKNNIRWGRNELLWVLPLLFFCYFFFKAIHVPITHDESGSCLFYSSLPVKAILLYDDPWPTNHILNTLAVKLTTFLFGLTQLSGRLPNLVTSVVFLFFVLNISRFISSTVFISLTIFLIFLANPYMNDFFSLARGYGMAVAFMTASLYYFISALKSITYRNFSLSLLFAWLAVSANFSWLIFYASLNGILALICIRALRQKQINFRFFFKLIFILFLFDFALAAFCYYPVTRMNATNQFQFWGGAGFYQETFYSLYDTFLFGKKYFEGQDKLFPKILFGLLIAIIVFGFYLLMKRKTEEKFSTKVFAFSCVLIFLTVGVNLAQHKILGTPYLSTRTALLYVPLIALMTGSGIVAIHFLNPRLSICISIVFLFFISVHLTRSFNIGYFKEWWFDENTFQVLDQLKKIKDERKTDVPIKLNTHWLLSPSINFYKQADNLQWLDFVPYHKEPQYNQHDEFYYTISEEYNLIPGDFKKIMIFDNDTRALFQLSK